MSALLLNKIQTIVRWEDTPQVENILPIGLGTISDKRTPTIRICAINVIIGINDLVLTFSIWWV